MSLKPLQADGSEALYDRCWNRVCYVRFDLEHLAAGPRGTAYCRPLTCRREPRVWGSGLDASPGKRVWLQRNVTVPPLPTVRGGVSWATWTVTPGGPALICP